MNMIYYLRELDTQLFQLMNMTWSHPVLDQILPAITDLHQAPWFAYGLIPGLLVATLIKYRWRAAHVIICIIFSMSLADSLCYRVIKPAVQRSRPPDAHISLIKRTDNFHGYSFPSNHAANAFALATVLGLFLSRGRWVFYALAAIVSYSRIYVGVHFPFDVAVGALLGSIIALLVVRLFWVLQENRIRRLKMP